MRDSTVKGGPGVTRAKVKKLYERGLKPSQIAKKLDVSTQIVYRHLQKLDEEGA